VQPGETGRRGEALAAQFLALEGYEVLSRNARVADVEVDLIARRGTLLVLVEVKLRRRGLVAAPQAVGPEQRRRLARAASALVGRCPWAETVRLDVVGIDWDAGDLVMRHLCGITG
jgi:putative endonuclease